MAAAVDAPSGRFSQRRDGTGVLPRHRDDARHHHGVLLHFLLARERFRQLSLYPAGRRPGHGVSLPLPAVLLGGAAVGPRVDRVVLPAGWSGGGGIDSVTT